MLKANFHFTSQRFIVIALLLYRQFCNLIFFIIYFCKPIYLFIYLLYILNAFRIIIIITIIIILRSGGGGCGSWITVVLWAGRHASLAPAPRISSDTANGPQHHFTVRYSIGPGPVVWLRVELSQLEMWRSK
eukprot:gene1721-1068_t